jgi:hypothetical protein
MTLAEWTIYIEQNKIKAKREELINKPGGYEELNE